MNSRLLDRIRGIGDVAIRKGADSLLLETFEREYGLALPDDHRAILEESNGIEVYAGYFRLFGLHTDGGIDATIWNETAYWKFAWGSRCAGYWCFGETAWGDQYAYALSSLESGSTPEIFFLDAFSMTPNVIARSFREFFAGELIRSATEPYDVITVQARQKFGPIGNSSHLVYIPPVVLGGAEDIGNVQKMNARSAMICNGDIATQLDVAPEGKLLNGIQEFEDELGRMRLRLVWAPD